MTDVEHLTVALPADMAAIIRGAVEDGAYASSGEVVRDALRDWAAKRTSPLQEFAALEADINEGMADIAAGRVRDFDADRIVEQGRRLLAVRPHSD